jgi:hypothetical protein
MMVNIERNTVLKRYGIVTLWRQRRPHVHIGQSHVPMSNPCQTNRDGRGDTDRIHPGSAVRGRVGTKEPATGLVGDELDESTVS